MGLQFTSRQCLFPYAKRWVLFIIHILSAHRMSLFPFLDVLYRYAKGH